MSTADQQRERSLQTVLSFISALNNGEYAQARQYAHDRLRFEGVLGTREGADAYFSDMEKMQLQYYIRKSVADETDVSLLYDLSISGKMITCCGWYGLKEGKIALIRAIFDPRPLLEEPGK